MKVPSNKIPEILADFINRNIVAKAPNPVTQFGAAFAKRYIVEAAAAMLKSGDNIARSLGIIETDGSIDLEKAHSCAVSAMESAGGKVQLWGIFFDKSDIDSLRDIAASHCGEQAPQGA